METMIARPLVVTLREERVSVSIIYALGVDGPPDGSGPGTGGTGAGTGTGPHFA